MGPYTMRTYTLAACSVALLLSAAALATDAPRMQILEHQDVSGKVFKRLGLPNQDYCYQQCLQEDRCVATRWGFIEGTTPGQCQLLTGELNFSAPRDIKTDDGQRIVVIVSLKATE